MAARSSRLPAWACSATTLSVSMSVRLELDRGIHLDVGPSHARKHLAERERLARRRQAGLALQLGGPGAERVSEPRHLRLERRQPEAFPGLARAFHELALGQ